MAELENNKFSIKNEYFDLLKLIWETLEVFKHEANCNKVKFDAKISKKSDLHFFGKVFGDPRRFTQILNNFISNALKFSNKRGTISINIEVIDIQKVRETSATDSP